jgi:hypothetical protein
MFNPIIRGWLHCYGRFYRSAVYLSLLQLDKALARWASQKYKSLRRRQRKHINGSPGCPGVLRRCSLTGRW